MQFKQIKYYHFGIFRGWLKYRSGSLSKCSFILHPRAHFFRHVSARVKINGRLIFAYPRWGSRVKKFNHAGQLYLDENSQLAVNGLVECCPGVNLVLTQGSSLTIGSNTYFAGNGTYVFSSHSSIGNDCAFAWDVTLMDTDLHHRFKEDGSLANPSKPIKIGNKVWVGHRVSILKGVEIGDNSIVAAGSVVTKSFPRNSVIAGQPAKRIAENNGTWSHLGLGIRR